MVLARKRAVLQVAEIIAGDRRRRGDRDLHQLGPSHRKVRAQLAEAKAGSVRKGTLASKQCSGVLIFTLGIVQ